MEIEENMGNSEYRYGYDGRKSTLHFYIINRKQLLMIGRSRISGSKILIASSMV